MLGWQNHYSNHITLNLVWPCWSKTPSLEEETNSYKKLSYFRNQGKVNSMSITYKEPYIEPSNLF